MGVVHFAILSVVYQVLTIATTDQSASLLGKLSPGSIAIPIDSSLSLRKQRDVGCEFSTPLLVTSISRPLPKISKPDSIDSILDGPKILPVSKLVSSLDSKTSTSLLSGEPIDIESSQSICSSNPNSFLTPDCSTDVPNLCQSSLYHGLSDFNAYSSFLADDLKPVSEDNELGSCKLSLSNVPTPSLVLKESLISIPHSSPLCNSDMLLSNNPQDAPLPGLVPKPSPPLIELLSQSEEPKHNSFPCFATHTTEVNPSMYPFYLNSKSLPDVVTPQDMSMVSNYPDFLSLLLPYQNISTPCDQFSLDTTASLISSRSIPYLKPIRAESPIFNDSPISEAIVIDNYNSISPNCPLFSVTESLTQSIDDSNSIIKPYLVQQINTISTMQPRAFMPMKGLYECPKPIPMEYLENAVPPRVPITLLKTEINLGDLDPDLSPTIISPSTNPREYIKFICSTINMVPTALRENNILPKIVATTDFDDCVTPETPNIDTESSPSNFVQKTVRLPEFSKSLHNLPTNPYAINIDSCKNQRFKSSLSYVKPMKEACTYYPTPVLASNLPPLSPTIPPVPSVTSSTASSTRPLNITPNDVERVSNIIGSNADNPTVILSFPEQSTAFQLPSIIGSDIYCTKDSIVLHAPSSLSPSVSCVNITPPSISSTISAATSKVVSSINNVASKIAKSAISSVTSCLKSFKKINPKLRTSGKSCSGPSSRASNLSSVKSIPPKTVYKEPVTANIKSGSSKIYHQPYSTSVSSSTSPLQPTSLPNSSFNTYSSPPTSPSYLPSPVLQSYAPTSSSIKTTKTSNGLKSLQDLVLLFEVLKDHDNIDRKALETIISVLCMN